MQFRVFRFGLLEDGNVGVGVFPQREEILIRGSGFGGVALQGVGAGEAQAGQCAPGKVPYQTSVVNELLKFCCRLVPVAKCEIGFPTHINWRQVHEGVGYAKFYRTRLLQESNREKRSPALPTK